MIRNGGQLFLPENSTENGGKPQIRYYDNEQFANLALDEKTGASIDLSIDTSTYVMTVALKNADGTIISSGNIDFPIESVVVNATYENGILTLVLQNGNSLNVDISDIISGLVAEDGDGSNVTASFTESATRTNITTGEKLSVLFGKIKKWFTDLKSLAFKSKTEAGDYTEGSITSTDTDSTIAKTSGTYSGMTVGNATNATNATNDSNGQKIVDTYAKITQVSNPNLLINPDFSINQRGQKSYTTNGYTVDRWKSANTTTMVNSDKTITVALSAAYSHNMQIIEDYEKLKGKQVTFTVNFVSETHTTGTPQIRIYDGVNGTSVNINGAGTYSITHTVSANATKLECRKYYNGANTTSDGIATIAWAKLEIGSVATEFIPPLISEELPKCQRYGFMLAFGPVRYPSTQIDASIIDFTIPTPVSLRTPPTLSNTANIVVYNPDNAMAVQTGFTYSVVHTTSNAVCIRATKSGHGLSRAVLGFTANIFLEAEIY